MAAERKRFRVRWSESARRDLNDIVAFMAERSPAAARDWLARIRARAAALDLQPRRGRLVPELSWLGIHAWRELIEPPFRMVYRVSERDVWVVLVVDGRRPLESLLLERVMRND